MLSIALVDDESDFLNLLNIKVVEEFNKRDIDITTHVFDNGESLLSDLIDGKVYYDIIFLDIQMPNKLGLEIAKTIRTKYNDILIVFVTSFDNYVFEAFDYDAVAYLIKNELNTKLSSVIERLIQKIKMSNREICFKNLDGTYRFRPMDILYFESVDHSIYINSVTGRTVKVTYSLKELEKDLSIYNFFRIHSGYYVNLNYVFSIENTSVILSNNRSLPISRHRIKKVKEAFQKNHRGV